MGENATQAYKNVTKMQFQACGIFSPYPSLETMIERQKTQFKH